MFSITVSTFVVCLQISDTGVMSTHELNLYLDEMQKDGTWGDGIVLSVAVLLYRRPIIIILPDGHTQSIDAAIPFQDTEPTRLGLVTNHYVSIVKSDPCINNNIGNKAGESQQSNAERSPHHSVCELDESKSIREGIGGEDSLKPVDKLKV